MAGPDERDQYSLPADGVDYVRALERQRQGLRVAWSRRPRLRASGRSRGGGAARAGRARASRARLPRRGSASRVAARREMLARALLRRHRRAPGARTSIAATRSIRACCAIVEEAELHDPPTKYVQAWFDRLAWWQHARAFFEKYDLLLTPTVACPPFQVGLDNPDGDRRHAGRALRVDAVHVPVQHDRPAGRLGSVRLHARAGCRSGLQIVGRRFDDVTVLRAAAAFERLRPWAGRRPPEA